MYHFNKVFICRNVISIGIKLLKVNLTVGRIQLKTTGNQYDLSEEGYVLFTGTKQPGLCVISNVLSSGL